LTVRNKLYSIIVLTVFFSGLSLFAVHQVAKGALFHELNSLHLKYTIELRDHLDEWNAINADFVELERTIKLIRAQPLACLENINIIDASVMTQIGTQEAIKICRDDVVAANLALKAIGRHRSNQIPLANLWSQLSKATKHFSKNSSLFEKMITKTVHVMTTFYSWAILLLSISVVLGVFRLVQTISMVIQGRAVAEAALKESESQFRSIVENAGDAIYIHDRYGKIYSTNELASAQTGYSHDELANMTVEQLDAASKTDSHSETWDMGEVDPNLFPKTLETVHRRKNGTVFPIEVRLSLLPSDNEILFVAMVRDISERKQAQRDLEFQQRALDEHAIVSIANVQGCILYANEKFCKVSGYTKDELIGQNHRILKSDEHSDDFFQDMWNTISNGRVWQGEIKNIAQDGHPYWVMSTIVPTLGDNGKPFQYVAIRTDISKRKSIEQIAVRAQQDAEQANKAKSEFLSSMSHELRTPLNAILGFSQMLQYNPKEPLTKSQKTSVDLILKGGKHLLELVNDVLELSKIEAGKMELSIEDVQIKDILNDTLPMVSQLAESRHVKINILNLEHQDVFLKADFTRSKQILINFLSNAIKYNNEAGEITVVLKTNGETMRISVADTGPGIPDELQGKLFTAFNRLGAENSETEGTGIGLVVCKDLVKMMNGSIGFESKVGIGSTFWFELPLTKTKTKDHENESEIISQGVEAFSDIQGILLYVEDNPDNLKLMEMIVSKIDGLSLISAQTGEMGVELALTKQPDVIILDINLPNISGFETLKLLQSHELTKDIPVIAMSAAATKFDIEKGTKAGFFKYLTKPIQIPVVIECLRTALGSKSC